MTFTKTKKFKKQKAYSVMYAIFFMMIVMFIASSTLKNSNSKIKLERDMASGNQALLMAQGSVELAIAKIKNYGAGYELESTTGYESDDGRSYSTYEVWSQAMQNNSSSDGYFYTPIPGTGTADIQDQCETLASSHEDPDHSCNWNKLSAGETITIPLYSTDEFGAVELPADLNVDGWYLKLRTPCEADSDGNESLEADCDGGDRYTFDEGSSIEDDDSIVLWQLIGTTGTGTVAMVPDDFTSPDFYGNYSRDEDENTEIYEGSINDAYNSAADYIVLEASTDSSKYEDLLNFGEMSNLESLVLQLNIVGQLVDDASSSIPYLEWQLYSDASAPFADTKAVVIGKGYHEGTSGTFYYPYVVTRSTIDEGTTFYTLSN